MAAPSGNAVIPEKMQLPAGADTRLSNRQLFPDERDGFISWLRGEFAAANAIIDSLCQHLRAVGENGEYEMVIASIQQRRCNWTPVLYMQQFFSIADVLFALDQVAWKKRQRNFDHNRAVEKDYRKPIYGSRHGHRFEGARESHGFAAAPSARTVESTEKVEDTLKNGEDAKQTAKFQKSDGNSSVHGVEKEENELIPTSKETSGPGSSNGENTAETVSSKMETAVIGSGIEVPRKEDSDEISSQINEKSPSPKTFVGSEVLDGKMVNVVEGLKVYEGLFDALEISKIVSVANELRNAGRRGELQSKHTFVVSKRPNRGHGKEMIQVGFPVFDGLSEDENTASIKERKVEQIPSVFQDALDKLLQLHIVNMKPDYCTVDFFYEGDHSQPHMWSPWYGRPIFNLMLTDCDMVFGRVINVDARGGYRGSLKLSLTAGSLLALQAKSVDLAKHAITSVRKQRMILTFGKSQPRKSVTSEGHRGNSSMTPQISTWPPHTNRSSNFPRHPSVAKHFGAVPTTGVLQAPTIRASHLPSPNGMPTVFVPGHGVGANNVPYPAAVPLSPASSVWTVSVPPRHTGPPRHLVPGTGVFLPPPGSGHPPSTQHPPASEPADVTNSCSNTEEAPHSPETESEKEKAIIDHKSSPMETSDVTSQRQECNGSHDDSIVGGKEGSRKDQQAVNAKKKLTGRPTDAPAK